MERRSERIRSLQDVIQSIREVEQAVSVCQDFAETIQRRNEGFNDRRNAFKSTQDGGELKKEGTSPRHIGRTKGGLGSKLHAVCDGLGRPVRLLLMAGNINDIVAAGETAQRFTGGRLSAGG
jgi:hypothetical protein